MSLAYHLPDPLDAQAIAHGLPGDVQVEVLQRCTATNALLLEASTHPGVSVQALFAEHQTAGRGRRGRRWHAAPGAALTFSLRRRFSGPASRLHGLSLATGVAVARALRALGAHDLALKWPNDLLASSAAGGGKLGGVLIETRSAGTDVLPKGSVDVVIGVGINVKRMQALEARLRRPIASLEELMANPPPRNAIASALLTELVRALGVFDHEGLGAFAREWESLHAHRGARLRVRGTDRRVITGRAQGLGEDGALMLETPRGLHAVRSGSVSLVAASTVTGNA